ncbi:hypothetical protein [Dyadobacter crusticola]|uniref:hypothetical protein n=1 Tax=Dyadobacter crusticola TaxID=292407 RepID=UPI0004E1C0DA|nr:hypothetical protein [Dyadobacter crusticola]
MRKQHKKALRWIVWILLVGLSSGRSIAQSGNAKTDIDQRFFEALQDSAIKFEAIKPRLFFLQKTNEQLVKENQAAKNEQRFLSFQHQGQIQKFESQLADQPKKNKRWLFAGFVGGLVIGALITK